MSKAVEASLELFQTSMMEPFGKNNWRCKTITYFRKTFLPLILYSVKNTPNFGKFDANNRSCQLKVKLTQTNSNMHNSWAMFTFSVLEQRKTFWVNFVEKLKIVSLSWTLVASVIRTCRIQWCCLLFLFLTLNALFGLICS